MQEAQSGANNIGNLYFYGHGVQQDYTRAMPWYPQSGRRKTPGGMTNVGYLYEQGIGVWGAELSGGAGLVS